jgi:hypothetical protein
MKKYLLYSYFAVMFSCLFGAHSVPSAYQIPVMVFGTFLFGALFLAGIPTLWRRKAPLRGRGLNVEFSKHPIIYTVWLLAIFAFGLVMVAFATIYTASHAIGVVLVPWLY